MKVCLHNNLLIISSYYKPVCIAFFFLISVCSSTSTHGLLFKWYVHILIFTIILCTGDTLYRKSCRCGGHYSITDDDLLSGVDLICCDVCSLTVRVLYQHNQHFDDDIT